jgi:hypothetical protein
MNKVIVHTCSSILVRPNGIVRYINAVMDLQRSMGHHVIFVTDARPTQVIHSDETLYISDTSDYKPHWKDEHVWLQVDENVSNQINRAFRRLSVEPDLVVAHDLHSYLAIFNEFKNGIFVQHESDVLTPGSRYSFLDDDYLAQQIHIANTTNWRIGMTVHSDNITPHRPVYTPVPFVARERKANPTKGLLYIGDSTDRKGAREFMELARRLDVTPTVITHESDAELFKGADVYSFTLAQREEMYELVQQHRVAFISSKNECPGIAVLECLQYMPTIVDSQYAWTKYVQDAGAVLATGSAIDAGVNYALEKPFSYTAEKLKIWAQHSQQHWRNLSV